jgi:hypothetical protein
LFTVDSYVDKKYLLYSIVVYSWQLCWQEMSALFHCCLQLTVMLTRNICFIPLLFTVDSYVDKKCLLYSIYSIVVYSWAMLTRNIYVMPLLFTVDSYVDKKCLLYSIVVYSWQLCWQEMSALFHCCLQLTVMLTRNVCFISLLFTVDSYVDKKCLLYSIVVYSWQLCWQEMSALFHCCLQLIFMLTRNVCFIPLLFTVDSYVDKIFLLYSIVVYSSVMLTRNICFIPLLFTVDNHVDKKCLLYSIVAYSWQLCWKEMSALFHCCLQLTVMLKRNVCFIPLLFTGDSYDDKKCLLYSIVVYRWQLCWKQMSALFHCCLQLTVMLTRNFCFIEIIPLLFTVDRYVDKKCLLYSIVVYSWPLCWQEIFALFHCCLQLTVMLTRYFCFIPLLFTMDSYVDKRYLLYCIAVYSWQLCWQAMSTLFHCW